MFELGKLVSDKDMHLAHLALTFATHALDSKGPAALASVNEHVLPAAVKLARSPLIQGQTLQALTHLLQLITPTLGAEKLLGQLTVASTKELPKPAVASLAECVASVVVASDASKRDEMFNLLTAQVQKADGEVHVRYMAIVTLGAIGTRTSLAGRKPALESVLQQVFNQPEEMLKQAAACSLGKAAVGDTNYFVPIVMKALAEGSTSNQQQYHLLAALR